MSGKTYESYRDELDDLGKLYDQRGDLLYAAADCERQGKKTEWFEKQLALIDMQIRELESPASRE